MKNNRPLKFNVVTIGGATRDLMFYSAEGELVSTGNLTKQRLLAFEYGAKVLADHLFFSYGGGAANTAAAFAQLGLKTGIICRLGQDENGQAILNHFKKRKINADLVKIDPVSLTGFSLILTSKNKEKEHIIFAYRGANSRLAATDLSLAKFQTDWFYLSSLPHHDWEEILKTIVKTKKLLAMNPGSAQLANLAKLKKYLPHLQVFIVNRDEACEFRKLKEIKDLLRYIWRLGPKIVAITDGNQGAYVYDGKKYYFMKSRATKVVDTVGAGDAFAAGFTAALIYGRPIKDALRWGINNSAGELSKVGAQAGILNRRQINR